MTARLYYALDRVSNSNRFENSFYDLIVFNSVNSLFLLEYCETRYLYLIYILRRMNFFNEFSRHAYIYIYTRVTNNRLVLLLDAHAQHCVDTFDKGDTVTNAT